MQAYTDLFFQQNIEQLNVKEATKIGGITHYSVKFKDIAKKASTSGMLVRLSSFVTASSKVNLFGGAHNLSMWLNNYMLAKKFIKD